jgi:hypothetical protein
MILQNKEINEAVCDFGGVRGAILPGFWIPVSLSQFLYLRSGNYINT